MTPTTTAATNDDAINSSASISIVPSTDEATTITTTSTSTTTTLSSPVVVPSIVAAEHQMFAGLRSTMERNAQQWRSNFTNAVLRPLVQHHHHHHHHTANGSAGLPLASQPPPPARQQSFLNYSGPTAVVSANNILLNWIPNRRPAAAEPEVTATTPASAPPVVINLAGDNGEATNDGRPAHTNSTPGLYNPADRYALIDVGRLHRSQSDATGGPASSPTTAAASRPTQFDGRRAQILADLQNEPPHPNASTNDGGGGGGAAGAGAIPNDNGHGHGHGNGGSGGTGIFVQIPEAQQLAMSLMRYLPYVVILAGKYMIDHMDGILNVALLVITFMHANWQVKTQIGRQKQRSLFALLRELAYVSVVLLFVCLLIGEWSWYQCWFRERDVIVIVANGDGVTRPPVAGSGGLFTDEWPLRRLLYNVLLTDMVAKLVTVHAKICVTMLPPCVVNYRNRVSVWSCGGEPCTFVRIYYSRM